MKKQIFEFNFGNGITKKGDLPDQALSNLNTEEMKVLDAKIAEEKIKAQTQTAEKKVKAPPVPKIVDVESYIEGSSLDTTIARIAQMSVSLEDLKQMVRVLEISNLKNKERALAALDSSLEKLPGTLSVWKDWATNRPKGDALYEYGASCLALLGDALLRIERSEETEENEENITAEESTTDPIDENIQTPDAEEKENDDDDETPQEETKDGQSLLVEDGTLNTDEEKNKNSLPETQPSTETVNNNNIDAVKPFIPEGQYSSTPDATEYTNEKGVTFKIGDAVIDEELYLGKITGFDKEFAFTEVLNASKDKRPINTVDLVKSVTSKASASVENSNNTMAIENDASLNIPAQNKLPEDIEFEEIPKEEPKKESENGISELKADFYTPPLREDGSFTQSMIQMGESSVNTVKFQNIPGEENKVYGQILFTPEVLKRAKDSPDIYLTPMYEFTPTSTTLEKFKNIIIIKHAVFKRDVSTRDWVVEKGLLKLE